MAKKYNTPKGTRDFLPEEMSTRRRVLDKIRENFKLYGYGELDSPALEYLEVLSLKSGPEIEGELYSFTDKGGRELGLRFEFTSPLGRIMAANPTLPKPFKRFQIGKVWRYERPQLGRYREFYQADADVVGSYSMDCEVEIIDMVINTLDSFGLTEPLILLNNRKVLEAQVEACGIADDKKADVLRSIDKLHKIGPKGVQKEFEARGLTKQNYDDFMSFITLAGTNEEILGETSKRLSDKGGLQGINELKEILEKSAALGHADRIKIDPTLVRGLAYYTGPIFEAKAETESGMGNFAGGGRYDDLVEVYGGQSTGAVGISFGVERLIEIIKESDSGGESVSAPATVFIAVLEDAVRPEALVLARALRQAGVPTSVDLTGRAAGKQAKYAQQTGMPFLITVGPTEAATKKFPLKEMSTGQVSTLSAEEIIGRLRR